MSKLFCEENAGGIKFSADSEYIFPVLPKSQQSQNAHQRKGNVGDDIAKIRDAPQGSVVCKQEVLRVLRNGGG